MFKRFRKWFIGLIGLLIVFNLSVSAEADFGLLLPETLESGTTFPVIVTTSETLDLESLECHVVYEPQIMRLLAVEAGGEPAKYSDMDGFVTIIQYDLDVRMKDPVVLTFQVRPEVPAYTNYYFRLTDRFIGKTSNGEIDRAVEIGAGGTVINRAEIVSNPEAPVADYPTVVASQVYEQSRLNAARTEPVTEPTSVAPPTETAPATAVTATTEPRASLDGTKATSAADPADIEIGPPPEAFEAEPLADDRRDILVNSGKEAAWLILAILISGTIVFVLSKQDSENTPSESSAKKKRKPMNKAEKREFLFEFIRYLISGGIVTLANILVFNRLINAFGISSWFMSNIAAIVFSIVLAYVINRYFVFRSREPMLREFIHFFAGRLFMSLLFEQLAMYIMFQLLNFTAVWNVFGFELHIAKLLAQIVVVIGNYVIGKKLVFK